MSQDRISLFKELFDSGDVLAIKVGDIPTGLARDTFCECSAEYHGVLIYLPKKELTL